MVPLNKVAEEAQKQLQDFLRFQPNPKIKMRKKKTAWKSLDSGSVKINYDGAMFEDINVARIGVVVQNDRGEVLATMTERRPILESVLVLETLAARRAIQFAHEVGFLSFIFEGLPDSETSINAIRNQTSLHSSFGHIIRDIWSSTSFFQSISFFYICKQSNVLVDVLTKRVRSFFSFFSLDGICSIIHL